MKIQASGVLIFQFIIIFGNFFTLKNLLIKSKNSFMYQLEIIIYPKSFYSTTSIQKRVYIYIKKYVYIRFR